MANDTVNDYDGGSQFYLPVIYDPADGSPKILSPLSSANFDGNIPTSEGPVILDGINEYEVLPGNYFLYEDEYRLIIRVEDVIDPSTDSITSYNIWYVSGGAEIYKNYPLGSSIYLKKENWNSNDVNSYIGDYGWIITPEGNAVFSNVAVRGTIVAGSTYSGDIVTGANFDGFITVGSSKFGTGVYNNGTTSFDGLWLNNSNYWYTDGSFALGGANGITLSGGTVTIGNSVNILGNVSATSFSIDPNNYWNTPITPTNPVDHTNDFRVGNATRYLMWDDAGAGTLTVKGNILADSGSIGGFAIGTTAITSATPSTTNYVGISPGYTSGATNYTFWSGDTDPALAEFSVTTAGAIKAESGLIGGWRITNNLLSAGATSTYVGISPGTSTYSFWAGADTPASAPFSVTNTGTILARTGTVGGWTLGTSTLTGGSAASNTYIGLSPAFAYNAVNYSIWVGASSTTNPTTANFYVTTAGAMTAKTGSIGTWSISGTEIFSGTSSSKLSLNAAGGVGGTGVIAVGTGNHGSANTGFYADGTGRFSLSNQLIFNPSSGQATKYAVGNITSGSPTIASVTIDGVSTTTGITKGMAVLGTGIPSGTYVLSTTTNSVTMTQNATQTTTGVGVTFLADDMAELQVVGRIKGVIESINPILSPRLYTTTVSITTATPTTTGQIATITTAGSFFTAGEKITITDIPSTNAFDILNQALIPIASVTDSVTLTINITPSLLPTKFVSGTISNIVQTQNNPFTATVSGLTGLASNSFILNNQIIIATNGTGSLGNGPVTVTAIDVANSSITISGPRTAMPTAGTISNIKGYPVVTTLATTAGKISLNEVTMGLHPSEGFAGTGPTDPSRDSWYHDPGTGIRLDKYNFWLTNNQFRVGTSGSYFKWDGSSFVVKGGGDKTLALSVGSANNNNSFSIYTTSVGGPNAGNANTPFYVDGTGSLYLGSKFTWNSSTNVLTIDGSVIIGSTTGSTIISGAASGSTSLQPGTAAIDVNNNSTTISGSKIRTGSIESNFYSYTSGNYSTNGTQINLADGTIRSQNFFIDGPNGGNAYFKGFIQASSGIFDGKITAANGATEFGSNIRDFDGTPGYTGIAIDSSNWNNAWVRRTDGSVYFRAGKTNGTAPYIVIDSLVGQPSAISFPNFSADSSGNVSVTGNISSNTGTIGGASGFTITAGKLWAGSSPNYVGIIPASLPFFAGATDNFGTSAKFKVTNAGVLTATGATISGNITATGGRIGNWEVKPINTIYSGELWGQRSGSSSLIVLFPSTPETYNLPIGNVTLDPYISGYPSIMVSDELGNPAGYFTSYDTRTLSIEGFDGEAWMDITSDGIYISGSNADVTGYLTLDADKSVKVVSALNLDGNLYGSSGIRSYDVGSTGTDYARALYIDTSGAGYQVGTTASTRRKKTEIEDLTLTEQQIFDYLSLSPIKFYYISQIERWTENQIDWSGYKKNIGFIAEDFQDNNLLDVIGIDDEGIADYIAYERLPIYNFIVIKEQQKQIEDLQRRIYQLENK